MTIYAKFILPSTIFTPNIIIFFIYVYFHILFQQQIKSLKTPLGLALAKGDWKHNLSFTRTNYNFMQILNSCLWLKGKLFTPKYDGGVWIESALHYDGVLPSFELH